MKINNIEIWSLEENVLSDEDIKYLTSLGQVQLKKLAGIIDTVAHYAKSDGYLDGYAEGSSNSTYN